MTTVREVIRRAYRRAGLIDAGREPNATEADTGLEVLSGLYMEWIGSGVFGRMTDVVVTSDYTAREQDRILDTSDAAVTVTIPATVTDPITGLLRPPLDGAIILVTVVDVPSRYTYVYDSLGGWVTLEALTLDSVAPLAIRYRLAIVAQLAMSLADENDQPISAALAREAGRGMLALLSRYDAPRVETQGTYF